jgi:hypothetical protein
LDLDPPTYCLVRTGMTAVHHNRICLVGLDGAPLTFCWSWLWNAVLLISTPWEVGIIDVSHHACFTQVALSLSPQFFTTGCVRVLKDIQLASPRSHPCEWLQSFYNGISEVAYLHFCFILFVGSKPLNQPVLREKGSKPNSWSEKHQRIYGPFFFELSYMNTWEVISCEETLHPSVLNSPDGGICGIKERMFCQYLGKMVSILVLPALRCMSVGCLPGP